MRLPLLACAAALLVAGPVVGPVAADRVVSIGGAVTEIVVALGQQDRLVARDTTSNFPAAITALPDVGYARALSPEGVLSVEPDLIIASESSGPPETIEVLEAAGVTFIEVPEVYTAEGVAQKILTVGAALGQGEAAQALADDVTAELKAALKPVTEESPSVLFILSAANGRIMAGGKGSSADAIIEMAGGRNVMTGIEGYKPVSDEAIAAARPDVVLMMTRTGDHALTDDALFALPAIATTPAAQTRNVIRMDGMLLLGFGPRIAGAVTDLSKALHP